MPSKNLSNQSFSLLTDSELSEINSYEFRWWHFILAVMAIRAIVKIAQSS